MYAKIQAYMCLLFFSLMLICLLLTSTTYSMPGPHSIFSNRFRYDIGEILKKHGLPIYQVWEGDGSRSKPNPWLRSGGKGCWWGEHCIELYQADEIPNKAKVEIISYSMEMYEKRGRSEIFKIRMYRESAPVQHSWFSDPKPFFDLTIEGNK